MMERRNFLKLLGIGLGTAATAKLEDLKGETAEEIIKQNAVTTEEKKDTTVVNSRQWTDCSTFPGSSPWIARCSSEAF